MVDINIAKHDPASIFAHPSDVIKDATITRHDKIDILRRWAYDEREIAVAEEENMQSNESRSILDEILKCLLELGVESDDPQSPPTKQG